MRDASDEGPIRGDHCSSLLGPDYRLFQESQAGRGPERYAMQAHGLVGGRLTNNHTQRRKTKHPERTMAR